MGVLEDLKDVVLYLLRFRYGEIDLKVPQCIVVFGAGCSADGRTDWVGEFLLERLAEWGHEHRAVGQGGDGWAPSVTVAFVSSSTYRDGETTAAQALLRRARSIHGLPELFGELICIDPLNTSDAAAMLAWYELADASATLPPDQPTSGVQQQVQRAMDFLRWRGFTRVVGLAHPMHQTWLWPMMLTASSRCPDLGGRGRSFGRLNSWHPWLLYRDRAPLRQLAGSPLRYLGSVARRVGLLATGRVKFELI